MDDYNQIEPPPSFVALFASPYGHKLLQPMSVVRQRYEMCEDLAQALVEQALSRNRGGDEASVLSTMLAGLSSDGSPVDAREARWVVTRLAELLNWPPPAAQS
jgi:hypothetical protein